MKIVLCGHRGVGKTSLLQRLRSQESLRAYQFVDLDQKIAEVSGQSIQTIFEKNGEAYFRQLERETFSGIPDSNETVVAVGGGFDVTQLAEEDVLIFLQRESDSSGRIFLNRPRLLSQLAPLEEFKQIFFQRHDRFLKRADFIYPMLEGMEMAGGRLLRLESDLFENLFFILQGRIPQSSLQTPAIVTLEPAIFLRSRRLSIFLAWAKCLGFKIELRDDLLSKNQMEEICEKVSPEQLIYSFRKAPHQNLNWSQFAAVDWALELGDVPDHLKYLKNLIVSNHQDEPRQNLQKLKSIGLAGVILKSSPKVFSFADLEVSTGASLSFLPRSQAGRWKWYRLFSSSKQQLNYYRYWQGSAADQPSFFEMLAFAKPVQGLTAVLGDPVLFSYSPVFHDSFFNDREMMMLPIQIREEEWVDAFSTLKKMGLKYAAVTAPLKKNLFRDVNERSALAQELKSANTFSRGYCDNTDLAGFRALIEGFDLDSCAVWGGGGTLEMIRKVLPDADYVSVRGEKSSALNPRVLIWAAPRIEPMIFPPEFWHPKVVIDLNYSSHSPGIEYAAKIQAEYVSGLKMFIRQAQEQQLLWSQE